MQLPPGLTLSIEDKPAEADIDVLPEGLEAFNEQHWPGHQPWATHAVFLREAGHIRGGLHCETYAGSQASPHFGKSQKNQWLKRHRYIGLSL